MRRFPLLFFCACTGALCANAAPDQNWNLLRESGLSNCNFKQQDSTLVAGDSTLSAYLLWAITSGTPLYQTGHLEDALTPLQLDLFDRSDASGAAYPIVEAAALEVLRLTCYVYYNRSDATFYLQPGAQQRYAPNPLNQLVPLSAKELQQTVSQTITEVELETDDLVERVIRRHPADFIGATFGAGAWCALSVDGECVDCCFYKFLRHSFSVDLSFFIIIYFYFKK